MQCFSHSVTVPAGTPLGGYGIRSASSPGVLQVHGISTAGTASAFEIVAVDALYPGVLAAQPASGRKRIVAASHTHYAPMLDPAKPLLGDFAVKAADDLESAISNGPRQTVNPDRCNLFRGKVNLPVYRRFDFPGTILDHGLTRFAGFYPNEQHPVDRNVYLFVFAAGERSLFSIAYHACHPVTRHDDGKVSPDYVQALRAGILARFGITCCLFFLGCAADIRPNFTRRRVAWLPRNRLNWRFKYPPSLTDEHSADEQYRRAVDGAETIASFPISEAGFSLLESPVAIGGLGNLRVPVLKIGDSLRFAFLPFEISHRYHLDLPRRKGGVETFLVSCAGDTHTKGYLPHPSQLRFGGYEVDQSRRLMGLEHRVVMNGADLW